MNYNQSKRQQQYILQFAKVAHLNRLTPLGLKQHCLAEPILRDIDDPYLNSNSTVIFQ